MQKKKKLVRVPKSLKGNTYLVLPMVVKKEYNLSKLSKKLKVHGFNYSDKVLLKYLTSYHFRNCLKKYLEAIEDDTDPEYYIELYTYP